MNLTAEQRLSQWVNWFGVFEPGIYTYVQLTTLLKTGISQGQKQVIRCVLELWSAENFNFKIRDALVIWGKPETDAFKKILDDIEKNGFP
ncbi:MAG: hypothetical protein ACOH5I_26070 [Oligoflexus sp.]